MSYNKPARAMMRWSNKEIAMLAAHWVSGATVPELAEEHQRSYRAIYMQLETVFGEQWKSWNAPLTAKVQALEAKLYRIQRAKICSTPRVGSPSNLEGK